VSVEVVCRRCGAAFTADRADILAGPEVWRLCPACRGLASSGGVSDAPANDGCLGENA
jgi:hypothetical protein